MGFAFLAVFHFGASFEDLVVQIRWSTKKALLVPCKYKPLLCFCLINYQGM